MGRLKLLLVLLFGIPLFIFPQNLEAAGNPEDLVINEVMVDPGLHHDDVSDTDLCYGDKCEWFELYNKGISEIDLKGWVIEGTTISSSIMIMPGDYFIITKNKTAFLSIWPVDESKVLQLSISLSNSEDSVVISKDTYSDTFSWKAPAGTDISWEKTDPTKLVDETNMHEGLAVGGTPCALNSQVIVSPPVDFPEEVLALINPENALVYHVQVSRVIDGDTIEVTGLNDFPSKVRLLYVDTPEEGQPFFNLARDLTCELLNQSINLLISKNSDEQIDNSIYNRTLAVALYNDQVFNTELLKQGLASFYDSDNSMLRTDAWLSILQDAQRQKLGIWNSAGEVYFTEILPDPIGLDSEGEWAEIYNPTENPIILARFLLDDFLIGENTIIGPQSFLVFHRNQTDIEFNNTGSTVELSFPGRLELAHVQYDKAKEGFSWALINGSWSWTNNLTPGERNLPADPEDIGGDDEEELDIPQNQEPIEISTGNYQDYENYLVSVSGTVIETSGDTFYLDDGSGKAKVYIQDKTGIDKPEMHKGDTFEVTGIVNLYRNTWRVLPQKQDDIRLIECIKDRTADDENANTKKTTAKKSSTATSKVSESETKPRAPNALNPIKKVEAAESTNVDRTTQEKPSFWVQFAEMLIGLAIILLIVIFIKLRSIEKEKPLGSDFGDDLT